MRTQIFILLSLLTLRLAANNLSDTTRSSRAQFLSVQFMGMSYHPGGGTMPQHYPLKLDSKAYWVANLGVNLTYARQLKRHFSLVASASYYKDCAYLDAGYLHVGIGWDAIRLGRHTFGAELGPIFTFREDWHRFDRYRARDIYAHRVWGNWQYRFMLIAGTLEYKYRINERWQIHYSLIPAYPAVLTSLLGVKVKL
jgi:hypothetical protein